MPVISARLSRLSIHQNHRRIANGALIIGSLTLIAKLFAAGREMAIAWSFGVSRIVDAYQLALTGATWVPMMLAGVMSAVLVPRLVGLNHGQIDRREFLDELNAAVIVGAIVIAGLVWLLSPFVSALLTSRHAGPTLQLTAEMTRDLAPVAGSMILSGYLCSRLQARERYGYSVTEALPSVLITFSLLAVRYPDERLLVFGTTMGFLVQMAVLLAMTMYADAPMGRVRFRQRSTQWYTLRGSFALMTAGQLLITASIPVDQSFASQLGEGSVAVLGYANRIITLASGLGTIVIGRALLPVMSEAVAAGELDQGLAQSRHWSLFLGTVAGIASAIAWIAAPTVVRFIFERGAFSPTASAEVTRVLRVGLLQLPFYFGGIALVQWYAATARFRYLLGTSAAALVLKVVLNIVLTPRLGLAAIMLSTAAMYMLTTLLLLIGLVGTRMLSGLSGDI